MPPSPPKRLKRDDLEHQYASCISLGFDEKGICSSCVDWKDTAKGGRDTRGLEPRPQYCQCSQLWKEPDLVKLKRKRESLHDMAVYQKNFIDSLMTDDDDTEVDAKAVKPIFTIIPSNTQFVERIIKEAALCSITGRHEMLRSCYAIVRSRFVFLPKSTVEDEEDEFNSSANSSKPRRDSEATRVRKLIREVKTRSIRLESIKVKMGESEFTKRWASIKDHIKNKKNWHKTERSDAYVEKYVADGINGSDKPLNARQTKTGVTYTSIANGCIPFQKVTLKENPAYAESLEKELLARDLEIPMKKGGKEPHFQKMKTALSAYVEKYEAEAMKTDSTIKKSFKPLLPESWRDEQEDGDDQELVVNYHDFVENMGEETLALE